MTGRVGRLLPLTRYTVWKTNDYFTPTGCRQGRKRDDAFSGCCAYHTRRRRRHAGRFRRTQSLRLQAPAVPLRAFGARLALDGRAYGMAERTVTDLTNYPRWLGAGCYFGGFPLYCLVYTANCACFPLWRQH